MRILHHNTDDRVFIVAEIGNNHEGSRQLAEELIGRAAEAGADAVKFQTIVPERLVASSETARIAQLARLCLPVDSFAHLADVAAHAGTVFISTPFDLASVAALNAFVPAFKIASGDHTCPPLLRAVAATGKPMICSTGCGTIDTVRAAKRCIEAVWAARGMRSDLALLHCVSSYPVPAEQANLRGIATLVREFPDCTIGYSDHTLGIDAAVAAVAVGARIIEKHFTIAHDYSDFRDHQLSANPAELADLVRHVRTLEGMLGTGEKVVQEQEVAVAKTVQRSLAALHDLSAGCVLTADDLTFLRPATGIPASAFDAMLGRRVMCDVRAGTLLAEHMLIQHEPALRSM